MCVSVYGYLIVNSDSYKDQAIEFPGGVVTGGCELTKQGQNSPTIFIAYNLKYFLTVEEWKWTYTLYLINKCKYSWCQYTTSSLQNSRLKFENELQMYSF